MSTSRKDTRKYADRREYLIKAVTKRRKDLRLRAVKLLGSKCKICGYKKHPGVLDFHHINPATKSSALVVVGFLDLGPVLKLKLKNAFLFAPTVTEK